MLEGVSFVDKGSEPEGDTASSAVSGALSSVSAQPVTLITNRLTINTVKIILFIRISPYHIRVCDTDIIVFRFSFVCACYSKDFRFFISELYNTLIRGQKDIPDRSKNRSKKKIQAKVPDKKLKARREMIIVSKEEHLNLLSAS
ncbi:MAG: hypothetical protein QUS12_00970 [Methanosarcina sp.]|nr:hypothetical protein [Methanosarcina sp.]